MNGESWVPIAGCWKPEGPGGWVYEGPTNEKVQYGLLLSDRRARRGSISATVRFAQGSSPRLAFGCDAANQSSLTAGLPSYNAAYFIDFFGEAIGWQSVATRGHESIILPDTDYHLLVEFSGQDVALHVNGVRLLVHTMRAPPGGDQLGLYAYGAGPIQFSAISIREEKPKAFIVMQFGPVFNAIWTEVIELNQTAALSHTVPLVTDRTS